MITGKNGPILDMSRNVVEQSLLKTDILNWIKNTSVSETGRYTMVKLVTECKCINFTSFK